jgi:chemotaxis protein MotB
MGVKCKPKAPWVMTFADLMSLLMALFVLLFAMSEIKIPKYQAVVESMNEALGNGSELSPEQEQFFQSLKQNLDAEDVEEMTMVQVMKSLSEPTEQSLEPFYESLIETYQKIDQTQKVKIKFNSLKNQVSIVFPEEVAFDPGRAILKPEFRELLDNFFVFQRKDIAVKVVGHTDSRPVSGGRFKSNWELSSARASSVVDFLLLNGSIQAEQSEAVGVADTQPISEGRTESDYAKNRRVEVLIRPVN